MAQTPKGALLTASKRAGITIDEFMANIDAGLKRCTTCKTWKSRMLFGKDESRSDGLASTCLDCRHVKERKITKGRMSPFKGRTHTSETKLRMSDAAKKRGSNRTGKKHTAETRAKISKITRERTARGEAHYRYSHGKADRNLDDRRKPEYRDWRKEVFQRDNYTCQKCGDNKGGNLCAHHIKSYAKHPELRCDINNGITLCHTCHELEHFKPDSIRNQRKLKRGEHLWD